MRKLLAILAATGLLFGIAGTANAKIIGFNGTLSIGLGGRLNFFPGPRVTFGSTRPLTQSNGPRSIGRPRVRPHGVFGGGWE